MIEQILTPSRTLCGLEGGSKKRVLELLAQHITQDIPTLDEDELFRNLVTREKLSSTGIGHGIAIPHCRVANCADSVGFLIKLAQPIDFESIDGEKVDLVFALVVPEDENQRHLEILAELAERFSQAEFLQTLRQSQSQDELFSRATAASIST